MKILKGNSNDFFAKLLFILMMVVGGVIYLLVLFGNNLNESIYSGNVLLYAVFGILLFGLIILLSPWITRLMGIFGIFRNIKKRHVMKEHIKREKWLEGLFGEHWNKAKKIRVEEKKISETRAAEKRAKEIKLDEKKTANKKIKSAKGKIMVFCFILFILSIASFIIAFFYKEAASMALSLLLLFASLSGYRRLNLNLANAKSAPSGMHGKMALVKKLPRGLNIEPGRFETDLDVLYKLIEQKGRIRLSAVAAYFGIDKKKVEEWAEILEKHSLAAIHYPAVGEPELRKIANLGNPKIS